jgi:hypothetical protein
MASRSWRWLKIRILGLLDSRMQYVQIADGSMVPVPGSRLGRHFQQQT